MPKFSKRSKDNLAGVHPVLIQIMEEAIKDSPVDFTITEGVRSQDKQKLLYSIGRRGIAGERTVTKKDGVVNKSKHQVKQDGYGYAVDLYPYYNGKVQVTGNGVTEAFKKIAEHIKKKALQLGHKITWGGDWKIVDMPHFEI